jgi:hypothetical protein
MEEGMDSLTAFVVTKYPRLFVLCAVLAVAITILAFWLDLS